MEQVDRARRYLKRMRGIYKKAPNFPDSRYFYLDDVYSFFIHCYHIRDWLLNLKRLSFKESEVDAYINAHRELQICADLCNGSKHYLLKRKPRTGEQPHLVRWSFYYNEENEDDEEARTVTGEFKIRSQGKEYDALELAERCMQLWDDFIRNQYGRLRGEVKVTRIGSRRQTAKEDTSGI